MIIQRINTILANENLMNDVRNLYGVKDESENDIKEVKKTDSKDSSIEEKLKKLKKLYDSGLISKDEYDAKRLEILDSF